MAQLDVHLTDDQVVVSIPTWSGNIVLWRLIEKYICPPIYGDGYILILVLTLLASASHFLVCTISCEPVVGFLPNFHGYFIWTKQRTDY